MNILGKSKTKSLEVNNEKDVNIEQELRPISYKDYLNEEKKAEELKIKEKISEFQIKYNEHLEEYLGREDIKAARERCIAKHEAFNITEPTLVSLFNIIEALKKQLNEVEFKYPIDFELQLLATEIDMADSQNEGIDIVNGITPQIEGLAPSINRAIDLFAKNCGYIPHTLSNIARGISSIIMSQNYLNKINKEKLIKEFNARKVIVDQEKKEKEEVKNLKKQMDELINKK